MSQTIKTRIQQRFDTYANWIKIWETFKPLKGEVCIFDVPKDTVINGITLSARTILQKVGDSTNGNDGTTLKDLPWQSFVHNHDDIYYTKGELDAELTAKLDISSISVNNGLTRTGDAGFGLNDTFYNYPLAQTFVAPTVAQLTLNGTNVSGSYEVGTRVTVNAIKHRETSIDTINGNLTLLRATGAGVDGTTLSSSISKSSSEATVSISDTFTAKSSGTVTYTLRAPYKDTTGANQKAEKKSSVSFYWPVFYGATAEATPTSNTGLTKVTSFSTSLYNITTTATNKHIHFLSTGNIKLYNSLNLPITPGDTGTVTLTINGQSKTYNYATIQNCGSGTQKIYVNI